MKFCLIHLKKWLLKMSQQCLIIGLFCFVVLILFFIALVQENLNFLFHLYCQHLGLQLSNNMSPYSLKTNIPLRSQTAFQKKKRHLFAVSQNTEKTSPQTLIGIICIGNQRKERGFINIDANLTYSISSKICNNSIFYVYIFEEDLIP